MNTGTTTASFEQWVTPCPRKHQNSTELERYCSPSAEGPFDCKVCHGFGSVFILIPSSLRNEPRAEKQKYVREAAQRLADQIEAKP